MDDNRVNQDSWTFVFIPILPLAKDNPAVNRTIRGDDQRDVSLGIINPALVAAK